MELIFPMIAMLFAALILVIQGSQNPVNILASLFLMTALIAAITAGTFFGFMAGAFCASAIAWHIFIPASEWPGQLRLV